MAVELSPVGMSHRLGWKAQGTSCRRQILRCSDTRTDLCQPHISWRTSVADLLADDIGNVD